MNRFMAKIYKFCFVHDKMLFGLFSASDIHVNGISFLYLIGTQADIRHNWKFLDNITTLVLPLLL